LVTDPRPGPHEQRTDHPRLRKASVLALCTAILCLRRPGQVLRPQLWAEDGTVFFADAWLHGWSSVTAPYAGYLEAIQRLVALFACALGPAAVPQVFALSCVVLTAWVVALTLSERFPLQPRIACALAVVMVPEAGEVLLSLTNLQWTLAVGLLALWSMADPRSRAQTVHDVATAVLLGLTGPFSVLFAPLFVWRAWLRRSGTSCLLAAVVVGAAIVQLVCLTGFEAAEPHPGAAVPVMDAIHAVGTRLGGRLLLGCLLSEPTGTAVSAALAVATLGGAPWLALRSGPGRHERIGVGVAFVLLLAASLVRSRSALAELHLAGNAARYFFPLKIMLLWLVCTLLRDDVRQRRWIGGAVLAVMLATNLPCLKEPSLRDLHWQDYVARIRAGEAVVIPIHPQGWSIPLPAKQ
jgi:hypothetical protein